MTTLAKVAANLTASADLRDSDMVDLATIVAKSTVAKVATMATQYPDAFRVAGYGGGKARRSQWVAAAKVIAHYPLDRESTDDAKAVRVPDAWRKVTSTAGEYGCQNMATLAKAFASQGIESQGEAYLWLKVEHARISKAKRPAKAGKTVTFDTNPASDLDKALAAYDGLSKADKVAFLTRIAGEEVAAKVA